MRRAVRLVARVVARARKAGQHPKPELRRARSGAARRRNGRHVCARWRYASRRGERQWAHEPTYGHNPALISRMRGQVEPSRCVAARRGPTTARASYACSYPRPWPRCSSRGRDARCETPHTRAPFLLDVVQHVSRRARSFARRFQGTVVRVGSLRCPWTSSLLPVAIITTVHLLDHCATSSRVTALRDASEAGLPASRSASFSTFKEGPDLLDGDVPSLRPPRLLLLFSDVMAPRSSTGRCRNARLVEMTIEDGTPNHSHKTTWPLSDGSLRTQFAGRHGRLLLVLGAPRR